MDSHFDTEKCIIEVENRPAIWILVVLSILIGTLKKNVGKN